MQTIASLLLQYWSKLLPTLSKVLSPSDLHSLIIAQKGGLNSLIQWLIMHPDVWSSIAYVIKIILGRYVAF
ncbi:hypothetical protein ASE51_26390 [Bacillus sp. Root147]|nr:hypothetical protein ASE51_26390 [Bacillus sp. Root147]